ncbi:hypothetical protein roselon_03366 [Roseibacterium elongatum DSM 19469]|uniref:Uncharacterized protein n=1 Tax=Roseicyclus elongatus DSM 19469 TaxID=1294273 RepID=W8RWN9_9RHOB|nr:hypothetical protein [Roseibacterium elongatum]AHM05624.1 hypothetical protein roselon_03366 [Roseibacterium elongatum DSM 19469]
MSRDRPRALPYLWAHHRPAVIAFGLALAVAVFFLIRLVVHTIYWADPAHRDQPLEGWMTPGYVARSYQVDGEVLRDAIGLAPRTVPEGRPTLSRIAAARGIPLEQLVAEIEAALVAAGAGPPRRRE